MVFRVWLFGAGVFVFGGFGRVVGLACYRCCLVVFWCGVRWVDWFVEFGAFWLLGGAVL